MRRLRDAHSRLGAGKEERGEKKKVAPRECRAPPAPPCCGGLRVCPAGKLGGGGGYNNFLFLHCNTQLINT